MIFADRHDAGKKLAEKLSHYKEKDVVVFALPRGGVVTGFEIATYLAAPLDIIVPRKIGAPGNPELAIGAITEDGNTIFDQNLINFYSVSKEYLEKEIAKEQKEARRRIRKYRGKRPPPDILNKIVIVVDDGVATGSTMLAALRSIATKHPKKIVVAAPVIAPDTTAKIEREADEVVTVATPFPFFAVGQFYEYFPQVRDDEVVSLLESS